MGLRDDLLKDRVEKRKPNAPQDAEFFAKHPMLYEFVTSVLFKDGVVLPAVTISVRMGDGVWIVGASDPVLKQSGSIEVSSWSDILRALEAAVVKGPEFWRPWPKTKADLKNVTSENGS